MISKKICLVGDFGVGKTSLIRRFVDRQFSDQYLSTVGVKISRKIVDLTEFTSEKTGSVQLLIWDIEGHTKFKAIAPSYLQGASGVVIVADVTRQETVERLPEHINLFLSVNPKGSIVIAFNKIDLIDATELEHLIKITPDLKQYGQILSSYKTSAKTGDDVDTIFYELSQKFISS
ncbi:MAG TPA: Rab family GTPase [Candidatus Obscuribacterales bacterium]